MANAFRAERKRREKSTPNVRRAVFPGTVFIVVVLLLAGITVQANNNLFQSRYQTMFLTDEPGNWFKDDETGTPVKIIDIGDRVQFDRGRQTGTEHTVTLLIKPIASRLKVDQKQAGKGKINATFDVPGVYLFNCKVHPYMAGVVAVKDTNGSIPDVTKEILPFIGHLGPDSLPATTVLSVLTVIAPTDPNNDGNGSDAAVVGAILLANGSPGAGVTDGVGGQGIKPLPNLYPGWIQDTVALSGTRQLSAEVQGWIDALTSAQRNPAPDP